LFNIQLIGEKFKFMSELFYVSLFLSVSLFFEEQAGCPIIKNHTGIDLNCSHNMRRRGREVGIDKSEEKKERMKRKMEKNVRSLHS